jgi:hypothetical protein
MSPRILLKKPLPVLRRNVAGMRGDDQQLQTGMFNWFVGLEIDEEVWNHAVFSKKRDWLLNQDLAQRFFARVKEQAAGLMSDEHFTVDGVLIEAWAGQKAFAASTKRTGPRVEEIFTASRAVTTRTHPERTRKHDFIRSSLGEKPS